MVWVGRISILLTTFVATSTFADVPFCDERQPMYNSIPTENLSDIHAAIEPAQPSPFALACQDPETQKGRPRTGIFQHSLPNADKDGNKSKEFFDRVAARVEQKIAENKMTGATLRNCLQSTESKCQDLKKWMNQDLPKMVKDARSHLAVAQSDYQYKSYWGADSKINEKLSPLGLPKEVPWSPLTKEENAAAVAKFSKYEEAIKKEDQSKSDPSQIWLGLRARHFEDYRLIMASTPFLQYIKSPNPDHKEIAGAITKLEERLNDEQKELEKLKKAAGRIPPSSDALSLLDYRLYVEEVLLENPQFCGLASSLSHTRDNRQIFWGLAVGLPILATAAFIPVIAAVGVGLVAGGAMALESQGDLEKTRNRNFSQFESANGEMELDEVRQAEKMRDIQLITLPLAFGGSTAAIRTAAVRVGSLKRSNHIWTQLNKAQTSGAAKLKELLNAHPNLSHF